MVSVSGGMSVACDVYSIGVALMDDLCFVIFFIFNEDKRQMTGVAAH